MKIDTPVATMGIRGTTPHVEISDDGTVKFSTLIEEGKSRRRQAVAPLNQRSERSPSEPSPRPSSPSKQSQQELQH
jgi:hypothetical protein